MNVIKKVQNRDETRAPRSTCKSFAAGPSQMIGPAQVEDSREPIMQTIKLSHQRQPSKATCFLSPSLDCRGRLEDVGSGDIVLIGGAGAPSNELIRERENCPEIVNLQTRPMAKNVGEAQLFCTQNAGASETTGNNYKQLSAATATTSQRRQDEAEEQHSQSFTIDASSSSPASIESATTTESEPESSSIRPTRGSGSGNQLAACNSSNNNQLSNEENRARLQPNVPHNDQHQHHNHNQEPKHNQHQQHHQHHQQQQHQQQIFLPLHPHSRRKNEHHLQHPILALLCSLSLAFLLMPTVSLLNDGRFPALAEAIKLQPDGNKYLWSGESMLVSCRNSNNIKNAKTRWYGPNGLEISDDKTKRIHTESAGARLIIKEAVAQQDDGQYKCLLGSQGGPSNRLEEADFSLKTYKRPNFDGTEKRVIMPEDMAGQLTCKVEFDPAASGPTVTWSRNGSPIDEMHDPAYRITEYDSSSLESKLNIKPVKRQHAGTYTCHAIAETLHLSRPFEQAIELEVEYAPSFNSTRETVWVERRNQNQRAQSGHGRDQDGSGPTNAGMGMVHQLQMSANKRRQQLMMPTTTTPNPSMAASSGSQNGGRNSSLVQVELNCTCDSNPPASIIWSSGSSRLAIMKGTPPHVLEEPTLTKNGTSTTSILLIEYNLDPNWEARLDEYVCSASNMIGQATKKFSIQQGEPAPAFAVGPTIDYNQINSLISFTILGPKNNNNNGDNRYQQPDVDAFRIRVDSHNSHHNYNNHNANNYMTNDVSSSKSNSVIVPLRTSWETKKIIFPQNVTVNLGSLSPGQFRLWLEAHNAVGWSRHRTDLGEFKLVSNSAGSIQSQAANYYMMLISFCLTAFTLLISSPSISNNLRHNPLRASL